MNYLWDTNTASAGMAEHPSIEAHLQRLDPLDSISICSVTRGQILYGVWRLPIGTRRSTLQDRADQLLGRLVCRPIDERVADAYALLRQNLNRAGLPVGTDNDLWIAAAGIAYDCILVSDQRNFAQISGLRVANWLI